MKPIGLDTGLLDTVLVGGMNGTAESNGSLEQLIDQSQFVAKNKTLLLSVAVQLTVVDVKRFD
jgi:hypothetical protein